MVMHTFPAMGTTVELRLDAPDTSGTSAALERAAEAFALVEATCSRFDRKSELSRLNASRVARVSELLADILALALDGRERTKGLFDPTVHDAVVSAGYDRTFAELTRSPARPGVPAGGRVTLNSEQVALGPDTRIDLGGIAKGYAVDRACDELAPFGRCLVDAGGDMAMRGTWTIGVQGGPTLELTDAAIATSGRDRRTWPTGAGVAHHLIDPSTGHPAVTRTLRATVVARTAAEAEVLAKAAFLGASVDAPTVLVEEDGTVVLAGGLM
jgi:thiamine biosynthesis lipoprotein